MTEKRWPLWIALVGLGTGGFLLHSRIHPPATLTYFWPSFFGVVDLVLVSILFLFRSTAVWALLLNSFMAYLGIIMMTDFTIFSTCHGLIKASPASQPVTWLLQTMFPDDCILFADFMVGQALYKATITAPRHDS